ncbi:hypothetical protein L7F22_002291 [Adiantum nelumboides]|nr:hypothetical protein [Adiantum nelumboides]
MRLVRHSGLKFFVVACIVELHLAQIRPYQFNEVSQSLAELSKGFYGHWKDGKWVRAAISARYRNRLRKETLLSGEEWAYDKPRKEMKPKMKGHKCDRLAAAKRARTEELMKKMPQMLFDMKVSLKKLFQSDSQVGGKVEFYGGLREELLPMEESDIGQGGDEGARVGLICLAE